LRRFSFKYPTPHLTTLPEKLSISTIKPGILDGSESDAVCLFKDDEDEKTYLPAFASGSDADESAKRGIATHYFMQFFDIDGLVKNGARAELSRLVKCGFISDEDGKRVRIKEIEAFARSELFWQMQSAKRLYREFRFNLPMPAADFAENKEDKELYADRTILVQGVIDCIVERTDGSLALYDYKTDRLTREERDDPTLGRERLREKHKTQLNLYARAVERIFGKKCDAVEVYSLVLGETVDVKE
jgi:ATP-dependent helicase/nuclease subunit A